MLFLSIAILVLVVLGWHLRRQRPVQRSVAILVLGDFGRSPRMMYHAKSLVENGFDTFVIAYQGAKK